MKIIPLSEGSFTIDGSKKFVPFEPSEHHLKDRSRGSLLVEIQPFVIVTSKDIILLDTGLGFKEKDGILQLHKNLVAENINPLDITKVLLTHLHKDHAGGLSVKNDILGTYELSFPQAVHYIQKKELEYAFEKGPSSYIPEELDILRNSDNLVLLEGNGHLDGYIEYQLSSGHCPWHQVFWIRERDQTIFFGGDEAPQLHQMRNRFIAKYDHDGKRAMELRQLWWDQGQKEKWTFLFYHDLKKPYYESGKIPAAG